MYGEMMDRAEMLRRLADLNDFLVDENDKMTLILGGASNVILTNINPRLSGDIDSATRIRKYTDRLNELDINSDMVNIALLPSGFEDRAWLFQRYSNLDIYLLDSYDFIVSKIATRREKSPQDIDDVIATVDNYEERFGYTSFNFEYLKELALEALSHSIVDPDIVKSNFNYLSHRYLRNEKI